MEATKLFYCYAHKDKSLQDQLIKQLASLERLGLIAGWSDRDIGAGLQWQKEIDKRLNAADIILLLISPDFIASNYCYSVEMKRAMKRHEAGEARVIPIILRPAYWQKMPFGQLQALPAEGKPITTWGNSDEAFLDVTQGVRKAIEEFLPISDAGQRQDKLNIGTPIDNRIQAFDERLDWKPYLNTLAMDDTNDDNFKNFIALRKIDRVEEQVNGTKRKIGLLELDTFIDDWLKDKKTPHLAILGGYGAGKTWYCRWLARKLATSYLNGDSQEEVPVLISLRLFTEVTDLPSVLELFWDHMGNGDFTLFKQAVFQGNVLVILDGFDEMSLNFRKQVRSDNFLKLRRLFTGRSKIIITSRDTYFMSEEEQQRSLTPPPFPSLIPSLDTSLLSKSQIAPIRTIHLDGFNRNDIRRYFALLLGEEPGKDAYQRVAATYDLLDLASRPILANIIAKTFEDIEEDVVVNAAVLYDRYTTRWMERESWRLSDFRIVRTFMQFLAVNMRLNKSTIVSDAFFDSMINDHFRSYPASNDDLQDTKRKIQNCSFLTRDSSGQWSFIHRSFMEFFCAQKCYGDFATGAVDFTSSFPMTKNAIDGLCRFLDILLPTTRSAQARFSLATIGDMGEVRAFFSDMLISNKKGNEFGQFLIRSRVTVWGYKFFQNNKKLEHLVDPSILERLESDFEWDEYLKNGEWYDDIPYPESPRRIQYADQP